jgi:hypothetical protein
MATMASEHIRRVRPASGVLFQTLTDGSSVLLDMDREVYFGLDAVGTSLWHAIGAGLSFDAAMDELNSRYDVTAERLRADLAELVGQLIDAGLVEVADE